jgi:hypothetical protein
MKVITTAKEHQQYIDKYYNSKYIPFLIICIFIKASFDLLGEIFFDNYGSFSQRENIVELVVTSVLWALMFSIIFHFHTKINNKAIYTHECPENFEGYDHYLSCNYSSKRFSRAGFLLIDENKIAFIRKKKKQMKNFIEVDNILESEINIVELKKNRVLTRFLLGNSFEYLEIKRNGRTHQFVVYKPENIIKLILAQ